MKHSQRKPTVHGSQLTGRGKTPALYSWKEVKYEPNPWFVLLFLITWAAYLLLTRDSILVLILAVLSVLFAAYSLLFGKVVMRS